MKRNNQYPLPKGWNWLPFGECAQLINGRAYAQHELLDHGTPVLRIQNLNGGDRWYYSNIDLPPEKYCQLGDLLFAWSATFGPYRWTGPKSIYHYHIWKVLPKPNLDQAFAFRLLQQITQQIKSAAHGVTMVHMTKGGMEEWKVPLPPIAEQKRIAAILDKAEELRSFRRQALGELDALTQSIFLEMFGNVGSTSSFRTQPLESLLKQPLQNGAYFQKEAYVEEGGIEMVHMSDAFYEVVVPGNLKQVICSADELAKYRLSENDLLIARRSLNYEGAAKPCLIPNSPTPLIFESSFIRVTPNPQKIDVLFLFHYLSNEWVRRKCIRPFVTQSTISGINQSNLARVPVLTPPLPLQQEFARRVEAIEQLKATHRESLAHLDTLFASLQHRAFRGEL